MERNRTCGNCGHAAKIPNGQRFCHVRAPAAQIVVMPQQHPITQQMSMVPQVMSAWPPVKENDFCDLDWAPEQSGIVINLN